MIIDEVLDAKYYNYKINIDYIKEEAQIFNFKDITKAIKNKNIIELKKALENYIINNNYNNDIIAEVKKLKIKF